MWRCRQVRRAGTRRWRGGEAARQPMGGAGARRMPRRRRQLPAAAPYGCWPRWPLAPLPALAMAMMTSGCASASNCCMISGEASCTNLLQRGGRNRRRWGASGNDVRAARQAGPAEPCHCCMLPLRTPAAVRTHEVSTRSRSLLLKRESPPYAAEAAAVPRHRRWPRVCLPWRACRRLLLRGRCSQAAAEPCVLAAREPEPRCCRRAGWARQTAAGVLLHAARCMAAGQAGSGVAGLWQLGGWQPWRPSRDEKRQTMSRTAPARRWEARSSAAPLCRAQHSAGCFNGIAAPSGRHASRHACTDVTRCVSGAAKPRVATGRGRRLAAAAGACTRRAGHWRRQRLMGGHVRAASPELRAQGVPVASCLGAVARAPCSPSSIMAASLMLTGDHALAQGQVKPNRRRHELHRVARSRPRHGRGAGSR